MAEPPGGKSSNESEAPPIATPLLNHTSEGNGKEAGEHDVPLAVVTSVVADTNIGCGKRLSGRFNFEPAEENHSEGSSDYGLPLAEISFAHWSEENEKARLENRLSMLYEQGFELAEASKSADPNDIGLRVGLLSQATDCFIQAMEIESEGAKTNLLEEHVALFLDQIAELKAQQIAKDASYNASANPVSPLGGRKNGGGEGSFESVDEDVPVALPVTSGARQDDFLTLIPKSPERLAHESRLVNAQKYLEQAMELDEQNGQSKAQNGSSLALPFYEKAASLYLEISRADASIEPDATRFLRRTSDILDRMEAIKRESHPKAHINSGNTSPELEIPKAPTAPPGRKHSESKPSLSTSQGQASQRRARRTSAGSSGGRGGGSGSKLSTPEKKVLAASSRINGRLYMPWLGLESEENFTLAHPFVDPDGLLQLSAKQKKHLRSWMRPREFMKIRNKGSSSNAKPKMISLVSPYTIRQVLVTDCSFVSSLCIAASYERRSGNRLITSIIYPQDRNGIPRYNPSGKYMVKLWLNGVPRKVIIDDRLPVGRGREANLLGSYTTSRNELWVSIIEKAYMKIHGGYDFPGSNSGIDLFALTGWIPEGHHMHRKEFQKHRTWQRLVNAHKFGDCLVTVATGQMDETKAEKLGLVPTHAYAVLDVREACGVRMVLVKNPWSHMRWKGKYSPEDTINWTPKMRRALKYDLHGANQNDNGIFWIDYDSLVTSFNALYLNWNRELFRHRTSHHYHWSARDGGPQNDSYNLGYNPQYHLAIQPPSLSKISNSGTEGSGRPKKRESAAVWILLTRHVVDKRLETGDMNGTGKTKQQYLTIHLYHNNESQKTKGFGAGRGKRIFYGRKPFMTLPYSNNPHTLLRFDVPPQASNSQGGQDNSSGASYTVVISQHEKTRDLSFTLDVFSMAPFKLEPLARTLGREISVQGQWREASLPQDPGSAGGSAQHATFMHNPQWCLNLPETSRSGLRLRLRAPKGVYINVRLMQSGGKRVLDTSARGSAKEMLSSGDYREGFCYAESKKAIPAGKYTVIVSTWDPNQHAPYLLFVETAADCIATGGKGASLIKINPEGHGKRRMLLNGCWSNVIGSAAGCANYGAYHRNPKHVLTLHKAAHVLVRLQLAKYKAGTSINLSLMKQQTGTSQGEANSPLTSTNGGVYTNWICGVVFNDEIALEAGTYTLIPSTFKPVEADYTVIVYCSDRTASLR